MKSSNIPNERELKLLQDDYEERAAIIEFDSGLERSKSEMMAAKTVVSQFNHSVEVEKLTEIEIRQVIKIFNKLKQWRDEDTQ